MARFRMQPSVVLLSLAAFLNDVSSEMIYPLLPIFLTTYVGATPFIVGAIEGAAEAVAAFLKLVAGSWSDRVRRRKPFVVGGYALAAASRILIAVAAHWPTVLAARLIDRTGKGIRSAPRDAMISETVAAEGQGQAFGFLRGFDHAGAVIGPLVAFGILALGTVSIRSLFVLATIPAGMGLIMLLILLREAPKERAVKIAEPEPARVPLPVRFKKAMIGIGLFSLSNSSDVFLLLQANHAGVPASRLPLLWSAHHVVKALFSRRAGALSDRIDRRYMLAAGWLSYALIYLVFPFARSMTTFVGLFVLYAVPFTLTEGAERAWVSSFVDPSMSGRAFGAYYLVAGLCTLGGTLLFGWLYETVSVMTAFHVGAGLAILAALVVLLQNEKMPAETS